MFSKVAAARQATTTSEPDEDEDEDEDEKPASSSASATRNANKPDILVRRSISFRGSSTSRTNNDDDVEEPPPTQQQQQQQQPTVNVKLSTSINLEQVLAERTAKQTAAARFLSEVSLKPAAAAAAAAAEIQSRIQKQREEMRLQRERNLREFKSQLRRINQERDDATADFEDYPRTQKPLTAASLSPQQLSHRDRCAIKIQAAWRGHALRSSQLGKAKIQTLRFKRMRAQIGELRQRLAEARTYQARFIEYVQRDMQSLQAYLAKGVESGNFLCVFFI